ncbi:flagellar motor switch protein FliG [Treponema parvum]|uniref:Flagellar motor switch protein FliG n=1 Tax=Treponema parvum TaxID=138851 RepID=A0A975F4E0_9SPIR|nr:FliG C-terminal domain-containing protein [Treponema parvum]QTQ14257.1 flagellar motor switch protein FliG [Treponema parvum]
MDLNEHRLDAYKNAAKKHAETDRASDAAVRTAAAALTSGGLLKVTETKNKDGSDSVYRRVAKFLLLIGVDEAAKILPYLSETQTEKIIPEIASIRTVGDDEAAAILAEFQALIQRSKEGGGIETAKNILSKAFGSERASKMIEKTVHPAEGKPFEYFEDEEENRILLLLKDELPAVKALVLSNLKPKKAAKIIDLMEADDKKETVMRLAKMQSISPEVLRRVDRTMREKVSAIATERSNALDGRGALVQILKKMSPKAENDILQNLAEGEPELEKELRKQLFTLDDIVNADDRFIQEQLHKMDDDKIAVLIAGKPDGFRKKILYNVSKTRGDIILETEQLKKTVTRADSDKITSAFMNVMRSAYEEGKFMIKGRNDEIYV